jgi:hypothetical protein
MFDSCYPDFMVTLQCQRCGYYGDPAPGCFCQTRLMLMQQPKTWFITAYIETLYSSRLLALREDLVWQTVNQMTLRRSTPR